MGLKGLKLIIIFEKFISESIDKLIILKIQWMQRHDIVKNKLSSFEWWIVILKAFVLEIKRLFIDLFF